MDNNIFIILKSLFEGNKVTYISTPINTGERYIDWYLQYGRAIKDNSLAYNTQKNIMVVQPNIENTKEIIRKLRLKINRTIIDPTTLENDKLQWSQNEFYDFWDKVIKELVNDICFLNGWEYSVGCCCELLSAIKYNVNIYTEDMKPMTLTYALSKIENSINTYTMNNMTEYKKLQSILNDIKSIVIYK